MCFLRRLFEAYADFPASLTWFEPLAVFTSLLYIGGGHRPRSSSECTHSYFLQLEAFATVKKKSEVIEYIRWNASSELHLFLITGFHLSYHVR